ncbi:hypothetical protein AB0E08_17745 [Streptomyces sp. NPDC048281]|uniref:hypothetical protein n=1 Tax=Streptomyces sp. NPDC048281 TaxID=3154715 RepID=UPI0034400A72
MPGTGSPRRTGPWRFALGGPSAAVATDRAEPDIHDGAMRGDVTGHHEDLAQDEFDGLVLLRSTADALPGPEEVDELARAARATGASGAGREDSPDAMATVVVAIEETVPASLWTRLDETLGTLRARGVTTVRLVLGGAGARPPDGTPAVAQEIADAWGIDVLAADGATMIVPGGSLFVPEHAPTDSGWWRFRPDAQPEPLGRRHPAPIWQPALARLPAATLSGCVVEQIPAGLLVRPADTPPPLDDLHHAVPADPEHPVLLIAGEVPSDDLAVLYAALPGAVRDRVRLAPGDHRDLLPTAQELADLLDIQVELLTGLPLLVGSDGDVDPGEALPALLHPDGRPGWQPYATAVLCRPAPAAPRLLRWRPPVPQPEPLDPGDSGTVLLADGWAVHVTRAGFALGPRTPRPALAARPAAADQIAVELALEPGEPVPGSFADALSGVLAGLAPESRELVTLHAPPLPLEEARRLRRIAVRQGMRAVCPVAEEPQAQESAPAAPATQEPLPGLPQRPRTPAAGPAADGPAAETDVSVPASAVTAEAPGLAAALDLLVPAARPVADGPAAETDVWVSASASASAATATATAEAPDLQAALDLLVPSSSLATGTATASDVVASASQPPAVDLAAPAPAPAEPVGTESLPATRVAEVRDAPATEPRTPSAHDDASGLSPQLRQLRARIATQRGRHAAAAELHRDVALRLLESRGPGDAEARQEVIDADTSLRAVTDVAEARRLAPSILDLLRSIPDSEHLLTVTERHIARLDVRTAATAPSGPPPPAAAVPVVTRPQPALPATGPPEPQRVPSPTESTSDPRPPEMPTVTRIPEPGGKPVAAPRIRRVPVTPVAARVPGPTEPGRRSGQVVSPPPKPARPTAFRTKSASITPVPPEPVPPEPVPVAPVPLVSVTSPSQPLSALPPTPVARPTLVGGVPVTPVRAAVPMPSHPRPDAGRPTAPSPGEKTPTLIAGVPVVPVHGHGPRSPR